MNEKRRHFHILLVDDSLDMRQAVKKFLEECGYKVTVAFDGEHGLMKLRQGTFALVITDWRMPKMTGIELIGKMRDDQRLRKIPIIMLTTSDAEELQKAALAAGADAFISKNADNTLELIQEKIAELLERTSSHH